MSTPLSVLIVEDSEDDALLLLRELSKGGYDPTFERVETPEAMSAALDKQNWDIVLSDYSMPNFSVPAALTLLNEKGLDLPLIVVSGKIGEDTAVEMMKAGALDYIMKDNLARLVPAIKRELYEADVRRKRNQAELELKQSHKRFAAVLDSMDAAVYVADMETYEILFLNHYLRRTIGDAIGKTCWETLYNYQSGPCDFCTNDRLLAPDGKPAGVHTWEFHHPINGLWYEMRDRAIPWVDGRIVRMKVAIDITQRKLAQEELQNSFEKLRKAMNGIIQAMAYTVETKDPYTAGHQQRVADLARAIADEMSLSRERIDGLRMAGVIHDIGKLTVPAEILSKPGKISKIELELIETHPQVGYDILKEIEFPWPVARILFQHHERMDGSGYPSGISGEEILVEARILAVADVVEAIASHRPYRPALGIEKALEEISRNRGVLYDPMAVDACLKLFHEKGFKFQQNRFSD